MRDEPFPLWVGGVRYFSTGEVTSDGRYIYRHENTRQRFVFDVVDDEWTLVPLSPTVPCEEESTWFDRVIGPSRHMRSLLAMTRKLLDFSSRSSL